MSNKADLEVLISLTEQWAEDRNLIEGSDAKNQFHKLIQECGELSDSICKGKDASDDVGDILVVLIIMAKQLGLDLATCLNVAYNDIKDRKGKMIDGVFVKESDLAEL
jgi:NTP pyrophosphatase (non-canonical NTP hydrolase)